MTVAQIERPITDTRSHSGGQSWGTASGTSRETPDKQTRTLLDALHSDDFLRIIEQAQRGASREASAWTKLLLPDLGGVYRATVEASEEFRTYNMLADIVYRLAEASKLELHRNISPGHLELIGQGSLRAFGAANSNDPPQETANEVLEEFKSLGSDWDGYGAEPISPIACELAKRFLGKLPRHINECELYPEPDGSVGWECHKDGVFSLYLSFSPKADIAYVAVYRKDGNEEVHRGRGINMLEKLPRALHPFLDELFETMA